MTNCNCARKRAKRQEKLVEDLQKVFGSLVALALVATQAALFFYTSLVGWYGKHDGAIVLSMGALLSLMIFTQYYYKIWED